MERAGVSAAQNWGSDSSDVVEMVSKAGYLTQKHRLRRESGRGSGKATDILPENCFLCLQQET